MNPEDLFWQLGTLPKPDWPLGGKGEGLHRLWSAGLPVPATLVVSPAGAELLASDVEIDLLVERIRQISGDHEVIVRSSADVEDGMNESYAGIFVSVAGVRADGTDLAEAAREVLASYSAATRDAYEGGSPEGRHPGDEASHRSASGPLVIQPYLAARVGGVLFTKATFEDGRTGALVEAAVGGPSQVVEGRQTTRMVRLDDGIHVLSREGGDVPIDLSTLKRLFDYQDAVDTAVGGPADVEWLIGGDGAIWLLQARPISRQPVVTIERARGGIPASPGVCTGQAVVVDSGSVDSFVGGILIAEVTETSYLRAMQLASGIVTEQGGLLSHAAIVARERNIPCIVAVPGAVERFAGKVVTVDGNSGEVWAQDEDKHRRITHDWFSAETQFNCEEWFRIEVPALAVKVGCEPTPSGVIVHAFEPVRLNEAFVREYVARAVGRVEGVTYDTNKGLWIEEWSRMRTIRPILDLARQGIAAVLDLDGDEISRFYGSVQKCLDAVGKICPEFPGRTDPWLSLAVGEWCHAVNMLAAASVPEGYGMKAIAYKALELGLSSGQVFHRPAVLAERGPDDSAHRSKLHDVIETLTRWREWAYPYMLSAVPGVETHFGIRKDLLREIGLSARESEAMEELYGQPRFRDIILAIAPV